MFVSYSKVPPQRTGARSPPVGQTLGSDDPLECRSLVTERPLQKKHRHFGAKHRPKGRTVTGRPWWWVGTDAIMWSRCPKLKKKANWFCGTRRGKNHAKKDRRITDFWHFCPKNCDQKVTKFCSEKNLLVGKKKKKSPPLGQTLGSRHFEETPLSLGGGDFTVGHVLLSSGSSKC